jgi:hypothetical protein
MHMEHHGTTAQTLRVSQTLRVWAALVVITVLGGLLRFSAIGAKGLWLDEAFSIWMGRQSLPALLGWLVRIDQHPPLYYSLLHFWLFLGDGEAIVRSLSALLSTLTIPVVYSLGHRLLGERVGLLAALVLALSPFHVQFAQEARMYALLAFCASAVMLSLADLFIASRTPRILAWIIYVVFSTAALLTHSTAIFLPVAANLFVFGLIGWRRRSLHAAGSTSPTEDPCGMAHGNVIKSLPTLRNWLMAQILLLLLWSPWLLPFVVQAGGVYREFWIPRPNLGTILALFGTFLGTHLLGDVSSATIAALLLLPMAVFGGIRLRRQPVVLAFLLTFLLTPIAGELLVSLRRPIFYDRTLIWASIPLYLLIAAGLDRLSLAVVPEKQSRRSSSRSPDAAWPACLSCLPVLPVAHRPGWHTPVPAPQVQAGQGGTHLCLRHRCRQARVEGEVRAVPALLGGLALLVVVNGLSLRGYYVDYQKEGWREAAAYVASRVRSDDLVLFNATWIQIPFDYYFRDAGRGATEHGLPADLFDRGVLEPKMAASDLPRLRDLIRGRQRVWLVYSHNWYTDPDGLIPATLDDEMALLETRPFYGLELKLYGPKVAVIR